MRKEESRAQDIKALMKQLEQSINEAKLQKQKIKEKSDNLLNIYLKRAHHKFDYGQLKNHIAKFKEDLLNGAIEASNLKDSSYEDPKELKKAEEIFRRAREDPLLSILFKQHELDKVSFFGKVYIIN
jgi:hypothetical protein